MNYDYIIFYDLETPKNCFLASFYTPEKGFVDFLINRWQNDLYKLIGYLNINKHKYFCGYNNIRFDSQVIEYIMEEYEGWWNLSNTEISKRISDFASMEIDNSNYGLQPTYNEAFLSYKQIDTPKIWHFFNENKRVSLKQLEFEMRARNIENMEFALDEDFTWRKIYGKHGVVDYCHNDVINTHLHFLYTVGRTDHPLYRGKDKIADREALEKEIGLKCLNMDDVGIGADWNKMDYIKLSGKNEKELRPEKVNHFYGKKFKNFFPRTAKFKTKGVKEFIREFGETFALNDKQEFKYTFSNGLKITLAKGGMHSNEGFRIIKPKEGESYIQCDIGSQYPNAIKKLKIFPKHLGKEWYEMFVGKIIRRLGYKKKYKETGDMTYASLQEMGKLSLNGGGYGRLNTKGDWQRDPCCMLQVTIGCQLEILMIVEELIEKGFNIVSVNTDGFDCLIEKERELEFFTLLKEMEKQIENEEMGNFEYGEFEWIAQLSVNSYAAKKKCDIIFDGQIKRIPFTPSQSDLFPDMKLKDELNVDIELHKNSSFRIIPLAVVSYLRDGKKVEGVIESHTDLFDFCGRSNSGSTYTHHAYKKGRDRKLPKMIRYYVAKKGGVIMKMVKKGNLTGANDMNVYPADNKKRVCNNLTDCNIPLHLANVDRQWYIDRANELIFKMENGKKPSRNKINPNQTSLF